MLINEEIDQLAREAAAIARLAAQQIYEAQLRVGVAVLDAKHPGWLSRIDTSNINLYDSARCILGQSAEVGGGWLNIHAATFGGMNYPEGESEFDAEDLSGFGALNPVRWKDLTDAWVEVINRLREERGVTYVNPFEQSE